SKSAPSCGKFQHFASCFLPQLPFVLLALGAFYRGYWFLLPALFLLVIVPLLDKLTGWQDDGHFQKGDFSAAELFLLHWKTRLYAVLYMTAVLYLAKLVPHLTGAEIGFAILSLSVIGGIAFAASHELLHGREGFDQFLQKITTAFLFYPHY